MNSVFEAAIRAIQAKGYQLVDKKSDLSSNIAKFNGNLTLNISRVNEFKYLLTVVSSDQVVESKVVSSASEITGLLMNTPSYNPDNLSTNNSSSDILPIPKFDDEYEVNNPRIFPPAQPQSQFPSIGSDDISTVPNPQLTPSLTPSFSPHNGMTVDFNSPLFHPGQRSSGGPRANIRYDEPYSGDDLSLAGMGLPGGLNMRNNNNNNNPPFGGAGGFGAPF